MTQQEFFERYKYSSRTDKIGGGSFGNVYKVSDEVLDRTVAIKVSEVKVIGNREFSLLDEFKAIEDIPDHRNIANYQKLYTYESPQGVFDYAIMQYYKDGNLSSILKTQLTSEQKETIAISVLKGIEHLHSHRVVHRDLKPSNILIVKKRDTIIPKITDFGLSKKADPDDKSKFTNSFGGGTLEYSSPEQLKGEKLRFNTDLWAFGVIAYQIFTGKKLFAIKAKNNTGSYDSERELVELVNKKDLSENIKEIPEKWQKTLSQCLERNPAERIKTVAAIFELLEVPVQPEPKPNNGHGTIIDNPLKYDDAWSFSEGLAWVELNGKYGFIDKSGKVVIPIKYDYAWSFSEGLAWVKLNGKYGFIDKTDKVVIPIKYDGVGRFSEGLTRVKLNGKWGFIDKTGKVVIPIKYDDAWSFSEGLALVDRNNKEGFIDKTDKAVIPIKYDGAWSFSEGLAEVNLNGKCGFIDKSGKVVIPIKYDAAWSFSEGLALVILNGKYGFIDKSGKVIIPIKYDYAWDFSEGLAEVRLNWKYGFIDKSGKVIIPIKYDYAWDFSEGLAEVRLNWKYGFIDKSGKVIIPIKYDGAWSFSEGLAEVKLNGKYGFIDKTDKVVIPIKYDGAWSFSEGLAKVERNNKCGFIDKSGKVVIPIKYDGAGYYFSEGLAEVTLNGKTFFINKYGKCVSDCPE